MAELAEQMRAKHLDLELCWTPRDQNEEADDLANGRVGRFDLGKRIEVQLEKIQWIVLPKMLALSEHLYKEVQEAKASKKEAHPPKGKSSEEKKRKTLKERQPW